MIEWRRRNGDRDYRLDAFEVHGDAAVATYSWTTADGVRVSWSHALILRGDQIVRIQDFRDPAKALKAIRRRSAGG